jgi:hypothetical protein
MAIEFGCPACGGTLQVGDDAAGRVIRCGGCLTALRVPGADAAVNPYEVDRPVPPPPPPARSTTREPQDAGGPIEPPRQPDDRPRRRRDPDDYDRPRRNPDDRPRRRPPPPPPPGRGVFFWLVIIGAVMMVGVIGCCGLILVMTPGVKWREHESQPGGFRVELPGPAQDGVGEAAGIKLAKGTHSEGAIVLMRAEQFFVFYRDVPSTKVRTEKVPAETDEQLIKKEIDALQKALQAPEPIRNDPVTVDGFEGREVEFRGKGGLYTARVIVADTRVYIVLAGGGQARTGDPMARRFIDSFKIIDPKLLKEGNERAERARRKADAAKEAKDRETKQKADAAAERESADLHAAAKTVGGAGVAVASREARARRESADLRAAAEAVAGATVAEALHEARPKPPLPVAPFPRLPLAPPPRPTRTPLPQLPVAPAPRQVVGGEPPGSPAPPSR